MRRMEKELKKKMSSYTKRLKEIGTLECSPMIKTRNFDICHLLDLHTLGEYYHLTVDYDTLEILGEVELSFYYDNTFGIAKETVPFYVNDYFSLNKIIEIFFGTPFDIHIEKMRTCSFDRYSISLPEIIIEDFDELLRYIMILRACLANIHNHKSIKYD
ncbi:hypothetical protein GVK87_12055 [Enterococcus hirae]|uniref:hypothetical protein n=1 Tax=Enterococcus hirae TaxID=1354 RepID=UPI0013778D1F|nr:hypothetical protein [Enterococcus hirae]NBA19232.1 hypothetical protein [Enterococcus hirae]NBA21805.1 hypothetical protein [Enterococcus hirae]NBA22024.1 hypothetical protein [Enterococcus hirae]NBA34924.1 hypothetical protein [Enterococcus hirae]NBA40412.1 hypothetical protein [Enterococcus hirae]